MVFSRFVAASLTVAAALLSASAVAHVTIEAKEVVAGTTQKLVFRVPHGCEGKPTNVVRIKIAEGVLSVKPMPKAGWNLTTVKAPLSTPLSDGHGGQITEAVSEVVWSGGELLDSHYDEFVVRGAMPKTPDVTLYFPVVQECPEGATARWIEIPASGESGHDLKMPAPGLKLVAPK